MCTASTGSSSRGGMLTRAGEYLWVFSQDMLVPGTSKNGRIKSGSRKRSVQVPDRFARGMTGSWGWGLDRK